MHPIFRSLIVTSLVACSITFSGCRGIAGDVGNSSGGTSAAIPQVQHVALVVLENIDYADVIGSSNAPYLNSLVAQGSLATKYFANSHPSIPNYFMMTTGLPITNDDGFNGVVSDDNVVRQMTAASKSWRVYAESIPANGYLGGDQGLYLRHHNPFSYFSDVQQSSTQASNLAGFSQFGTDIAAATLPNYSFIVPNSQDDAHDCPDGTTTCSVAVRLQHADRWLQTNIGPLIGNASFQQSGLLIIVFDESADDLINGGGHVAAVLVGTHVKAGFAGTNSYDHRSLLSLTLKALGVTNIPNGADAAPQMTEFFQ
jgi:hypothetical protein